MIFVDTNYFLRYFFDDIPKQHQLAEKLFFSAAEGKVKLFTDILVIFEIYWVVKNGYGVKSPYTQDLLTKVCNLDFVSLDDRAVIAKAIKNFKNFNYDLEDAYHYYNSLHKSATSVATFDKKLEKKYLSLKKSK